MKETIYNIRIAALEYSSIGLFIALSMFALLGGGIIGFVYFMSLFPAQCIVGLIGFYLSLWFTCSIVGKCLYYNKISPRIAAILITYLSLILGTFAGSVITYLLEGRYDLYGFREYIFYPIHNILIVGGIPALILALFLGRRLKAVVE